MVQQHLTQHDGSRAGRMFHVLVPLLLVAASAGCGSDSKSTTSSKRDTADPSASESSAAGGAEPAASAEVTGQSGAAAGGVKPCDLLTQSEMEGFFGAPVVSTEVPYESITTTTQCLWNKVSESVGPDELPPHYVLVQIPTDEYDLDQLHKKIERGGINGLSFAVDGVGDGAVLVVGGEGISVVVGASGFHLRIALDPDPTDEAIKALAVSAAGRLAQG